MEQGGSERFKSRQEEKSRSSGKCVVATNAFPRPSRNIVRQWKTVRGNTWADIRGCLGPGWWQRAGYRPGSRCGTGAAPVSWKRHLDYLKKEIKLAYWLVCFERRLAWRQRSEKGQGSLRGAEGKWPMWTRDMQNLRQPGFASFLKNLLNFVSKLKGEANVPHLFPVCQQVQIAKGCKGQLCQQHRALHLPNGNQQRPLHLHLRLNLTLCSLFSQLCSSGSLW